MKKSRKGLTLILTAAMALSLTACASTPSASPAPAPAGDTAAGTDAPAAAADDGQTYVINIGHINDERDSWHLGSEKFKEYVEEHSGGRIQVNIYPSSQLGTEVDMIQSILTQGGCDITFTGESMQTYQPDLGIIGMPYLIKSDEHMEAVLTGEAGAELEGLMEKSGMKVLGYFTRGPRNVTANKKITSPADMNNFVIRTPQSAMTVAAFEAVGLKLDIVLGSGDMDYYGPENIDILKEKLKLAGEEYDYIFIDFPPAHNVLTMMYLIACDYIIVPLHLAKGSSIHGYKDVIGRCREAREEYGNRDLGVLGLFYINTQLYKSDQSILYEESMEEETKNAMRLFTTTIRHDYASMQTSENMQEPLCICSGSSEITKDYKTLVKEMEKRIKEERGKANG